MEIAQKLNLYLELAIQLLTLIGLIYAGVRFLRKNKRKGKKPTKHISFWLGLLNILILITGLYLFNTGSFSLGMTLFLSSLLISIFLFLIDGEIKKLDIVALLLLSTGISFLGGAYVSNAISITQSHIFENQIKIRNMVKENSDKIESLTKSQQPSTEASQ